MRPLGDYENNNYEMFNDIPQRVQQAHLNFKVPLKTSCGSWEILVLRLLCPKHVPFQRK